MQYKEQKKLVASCEMVNVAQTNKIEELVQEVKQLSQQD